MTRVTADDVTRTTDDAVRLLRSVADRDLTAPAHGLDWTCWETLEHIADDLFAYAGQLGPRRPPRDTYVRFDYAARRPGGPPTTIRATDDATVEQLCDVLEASGAMLAALVTVTPDSVRSYHPYGVSDPEGFAAMGVVETLVHLYDVATALGVEWTPDEDLCGRVLTRLFPDAPQGTPRWATMLWATGRGDLPGRERLTEWRWDGRPRG